LLRIHKNFKEKLGDIFKPGSFGVELKSKNLECFSINFKLDLLFEEVLKMKLELK
jgi:hypothetical protein